MILYNKEILNIKKNSKMKIKKNYFNSELGFNVIQFLTKKINLLSEFIKKIIDNNYFYNFSLNYFGENTKNDFKKLLRDWTFQSIKWICDIYKMGIIDKNKYDSLHNVLNNLIYDKNKIDDYYNKDGLLDADIISKENLKEKKIFDIMNDIQRQKVVEIIYYMAKINRNYLEETFDEIFVEELNEKNKAIMQDLEFDE